MDVDYRSPFALWERPKEWRHWDAVERGYTIQRNPHAAWTLARDEYARYGTEDHLRVLLHHVTLDNPPDAPGQHRNYETIAKRSFLVATWTALALSCELTNTSANKPGIVGAVLLSGFLTLLLALALRVAQEAIRRDG